MFKKERLKMKSHEALNDHHVIFVILKALDKFHQIDNSEFRVLLCFL